MTKPNKAPISLREALPVWIRVAIYSFGGPAGQMAVMHNILVEEKRFLSNGVYSSGSNNFGQHQARLV